MSRPDDPLRHVPLTHDELRAVVREIVTEILTDIAKRKKGKSVEALVESAQDASSPVRKLQVRLYAIGAAAALLVILTVAALPWLTANRGIPDELVGRWKTSTPTYADVAFEITRDSLLFHAGPEGRRPRAYPISKVRKEVQGPFSTAYVVVYRSKGREYEFSFFFHPPIRAAANVSSGSVIRLKNQRAMEWRKTASD